MRNKARIKNMRETERARQLGLNADPSDTYFLRPLLVLLELF